MRFFLKIFFRLFLLLLCMLILTAAFLPALLSTQWGKDKLTSFVNQQIPGKIKIENLSLAWFGPQKLQGLTFSDPKGNDILTLDSLISDAYLFKIAQLPSARFLELNNLNATLIGDSDGNTNFMSALNTNCCRIETDSNSIVISLKNTHGRLNQNTEGLTLQLSGETIQNSLTGKFAIDAKMQGIDLHSISSKGRDLTNILQTHPQANLKINADISNFPLELIDQIVSLKSPHLNGLLAEILGKELNLTIDQKGTSQKFAFNLKANSPTLTANADFILDKELTLAKPTQINLKIFPTTAAKILELSKNKSPWHLSAPTEATLNITNLQLPLSTSLENIDAIGINASLDVKQANLISENTQEKLSLREVHTTVTSEPLSPLATFALASSATYNEQPTSINFKLTLPKKVLLKDLSNISLKDLVLNGEFSDLPLTLIDSNIALIAGPTADLTFSLQPVNDKPLAEIQMKSPRLSIQNLAVWIDDHLTLQKPAQVIVNLNQGMVNTFASGLGPQMMGPATAQLNINSFSFPYNTLADPMSAFYKMDLDAQLKLTSLRLANVPKVGGLSFNDFTLKLAAKKRLRPEVTASFSVQPDGQSALSDIAGNQIGFKTDVSLGLGFDGKIQANVFNIEIVSDRARIDLSGEMRDGNRLTLNAPSMLSYTFTAAGLQTMGIAADNYVFKHGTPLEMTIVSSHIPTAFNDLSQLRLNGKLKINDFQLMQKAATSSSLAIIDNLTADWSVDAAANVITMDFNGVTRLGENLAAGKIHGSLELSKWLQNGRLDLNQSSVRMNANATRLPTELVSALSGYQHLVPLLGNAMDLSVESNASLAQTENGTLSIDINSDNLSGGLGLNLGEVIQLNSSRPAEFSLKLTPQGYTALRKGLDANYSGHFVITEPTKAVLKLRSMTLPRSLSYLQAGIDGDFSLGKVVGIDATTKNSVTLNDVHGRISSTKLSDSVAFEMHASGHTEPGNRTGWDVTGTLSNGFTADGSINKQDLSMTFDANVETLPIPLLCQFACVDPKLKKKIEIVFGSKVNARIQAKLQQMNGPVYIDMKGENATLNIDAYVNQGIMTLNQDLTAQITVTPQLGEYVLKDLIPVLSGMLSADHPITLAISKEGFATPIDKPSLTNIAIGSAVLSMGKVHFSGESHIAKVLNLLTPATSNQLVWLTPAYFSLNQGVLKLERVDMLISDRYPIAAWGDADMGKDRVNMVIALAGSAISRAFNVPKIANSYFLQLPLKGKLSNPSIDKNRAIARISALVAQSQGGAEGLVIGKVIDIASGGLTENSVPPPTTNPLPWSDLMGEESSNNSLEKKIVNPIEEVGKAATSIFKKIFK